MSKLQQRHFRDEVKLSVVGLGGMLLVGLSQERSNLLVKESSEQGVNYFDVAPFYGDGEAEKKMGVALEGIRPKIFLACKTFERSAKGARLELERSLKRLRTDHFDLYQFHAVTTLGEVKKIFADGGAVETFREAKAEGKIRYIGFSAHSVEAALAMLERFDFDSILFPVNFVCWYKGNFGPQVLQKAKEKNVSRLGLKALALGPWPRGAERRYSKCWYQPIEDRELAELAERFALSEDVTAILPPGELPLFKMALEIARDFSELTPDERAALVEKAKKLKPLLKA
jgi:aryl-alcohol dehydrogenase-like predicted oxidoreductase